MGRLSRLVVPGLPHHVTRRGNGRARVFYEDADYEAYRDWLGESCRAAGGAVGVMPNRVHPILVPKDADGLRAALGETHRRYTRHVNFRAGWRGYLVSLRRGPQSD